MGLALLPFLAGLGAAVMFTAIAVNMVLYNYYRLKLETGLESMRYFAVLLWGAKKIGKTQKRFLEECDLDTPLKPFTLLRGLIPGTS